MADQLQIKQDPDARSPGVEDELEESTDLDFYSKDNDSYNRMYLARLPNYLWKAWSELDDDEEIQIGTIRQWSGPSGYVSPPFAIALELLMEGLVADVLLLCRRSKCDFALTFHSMIQSPRSIIWKSPTETSITRSSSASRTSPAMPPRTKSEPPLLRRAYRQACCASNS